jgi:hypothetical protein
MYYILRVQKCELKNQYRPLEMQLLRKFSLFSSRHSSKADNDFNIRNLRVL